MFKRTWIIWIITLALAAILSACGGSDLAEKLTPIPTLPSGSEPELVAALQGGAASQGTVEPTAGAGGEMSQEELVALGKQIFDSTCSACHGEQDGVGPAFTGMAERAATRVEGMSAEDYLHQSIVDPGAYVVEGFKDVMPKSFGDQYSDTELKGLVAYIMADSGGGTTTAQAEPTEPATPESTQEAAPTPEVTAEATAVPAGDAAAGEELFAANCSGCHGEGAGAGPARVGMGERAATRVAGLSAEEYLRQSIVDPGAYIVDGFSDIMPKTFADKFSEKEINDLIAYLLTQ